MKNFTNKNLITHETFETFNKVWKESLAEENYNFLTEENIVKLIDKDSWLSLSANDLFALCFQWRKKFLDAKPDRNSETIEWLICILRHNATNYDFILKQSADCHAWAGGFASLIRLQANFLIISHLQKNGLHDQLVRRCQEEWMWQNCK